MRLVGQWWVLVELWRRGVHGLLRGTLEGHLLGFNELWGDECGWDVCCNWTVRYESLVATNRSVTWDLGGELGGVTVVWGLAGKEFATLRLVEGELDFVDLGWLRG